MERKICNLSYGVRNKMSGGKFHHNCSQNSAEYEKYQGYAGYLKLIIYVEFLTQICKHSENMYVIICSIHFLEETL